MKDSIALRLIRDTLLAGGLLLFIPSSVFASFPSVSSVTNSGDYQNVTTLPVSVPSVVSGDRLLNVCNLNGSSGGGAAPSGWTRIYDDDDYRAVYEKIASGSEGSGTVNFTQDNAGSFACQVYKITGSHPSDASQVGGAANGTNSSTPGSGSLTPTGGAKDWLWISVVMLQHTFGTNRSISSYPTNYTGITPVSEYFWNSTWSQILTGGAYRQLNASSEDPGNFTLSGAIANWRAITIAVPPPADPTPTPTPTSTPTPTPTPTPAPQTPLSVTADAETNVGSYKITLNGSANPNNLATTMYFRVFTSNPGTCPSNGGSGVRAPSGVGQDADLSLTTNNSIQQKSYTTKYGAPYWLTPSTNYWYCTYATNSAGTTVSTTPQAFTTTSGADSPCDPTTSGDHTVTESCSFTDDYDGVDNGSGATNTGVLTVSSGANLTLGPGQKIGRGSLVRGSGASITLAEGATLQRGGVWVKDADADGKLDDATRTVSSTQPAGYVRRKGFSSDYPYYSLLRAVNTFDCDGTNANIYQNVANLVTDADNDGYKTSSAASTQCVGSTSTINTRTYYKDSAGSYTKLASAAVLGGGATDCYDNTGAPCPPNTPTIGSNTTSSLAVSWTGTTGPTTTSYNLRWCQNASCSPSTTISDVSSAYSHTGRTCGTLYRYDVIAVNSSGNSTASSVGEGSTSSCGGGGTWVDRSSAAGSGSTTILGVAIGPSNEMIAVGTSGYVRTSTDGGANWTNRNTAASAGTTNLEFAAIGPDGTMIIVGWSGFIATSTNGGANWTNRTTAAGSSGLQLRGAAIGPDGTMIVVGDSGYIRTSTNGGANWTNRNTAAGAGSLAISGVAFDADGTIIAVGQTGYIRTSTDGGANWTNRNTAAGAGSSTLIEASAGPSGYLIAVGQSGYIRTSTDGGANWTNRNTAAGAGSATLNGVSMNSDGSIIIAVGPSGYIRTSSDGGANWTDRNSAAGAGSTIIYGSGIGPDNEMIAGGASGYIRTSTE